MMGRSIELFKLFFVLGAIGFGGPVASIAMMETEVVKRRQWMSQEDFLDLVGATNLIPGPNSTEMAIHIGLIYGGWWGFIIAGISFILPAVIITTIFAWLYVNYGSLPALLPLLYGIKPAVLGIVIDALYRLGKKAIKSRKLLILGLFVGLLVSLFKVNEAIALIVGGIIGIIWQKDNFNSSNSQQILVTGLLTSITLKASAVGNKLVISLQELGLIFLKIGALLFGGGYVLIAFLQAELVKGRGWLTEQQLIDAIAVGQFTPGPILSTATFVGYLLLGIPGAIVATIAIFLPSFIFVALLNPLVPRLRNNQYSAAFLDAINVSAVALIGVIVLQLMQNILIKYPNQSIDIIAIFIAFISWFCCFRYQLNPAWLVLVGSLLGYLSLILK